MKICFLLVFLLLGCNSKMKIDGQWKIEIDLQGNSLPVILNLKNSKSRLSGFMVNSDEKIPLEGSLVDDKFSIQIGTSYSILEGRLENNKLKGKWIRTNKKDYSLPFTGVKTTLSQLYKKYEKSKQAFSLTGNWKVVLSEKKTGLGVFEQIGSRVKGSILTTTGDYRFLDGFIKGNRLVLTGFDGTFSNFISFNVAKEKMVGKMFSGKSYNKEIFSFKDEEFELGDPLSIASARDAKIKKFKYKSFLGDKVVDFESQNYKNKVKIIQVFGSWCPNCIDETNYFIKWRKENIAKLNDVKFIAMAFEKFSDEKSARIALKKIKRKLGMDYPIVLADYQSTRTVEKFLPISNFSAFPTTIFLNKKDEIVKIHTGFNGQATGSAFEKFSLLFNRTVDELIRE